jgi:hypothetical protein
LHYDWKPNTQLVRQEQQSRLIARRLIHPEEALLNLRDVDTGKPVVAHGGSVYWNNYRTRWVLIAVESYGTKSALGEIWFAEADTPVGPWVYARKILGHDKYSFYNPKQHPMFAKDGGRVIFFEGTYTTTFSGNPETTPRYDYNQIMYQLDLSDPRLALPVAIYDVAPGPGGSSRLLPATALDDVESRPTLQVAFFAPQRTGIATLPVYQRDLPEEGWSLQVESPDQSRRRSGERPLFFLLPADIHDPGSTTAPLYEYRNEGNGRRAYSLEGPNPTARSAPKARVLGRVWRNPARQRLW